jgi:hypothetical protein
MTPLPTRYMQLTGCVHKVYLRGPKWQLVVEVDSAWLGASRSFKVRDAYLGNHLEFLILP